MAFKKRVRFQIFIIFYLIMISIIYSLFTSYNEKGFKTINQKNFINLDFWHYYYNQLNDYEKKIYDDLINSQEKFLNGEKVMFEITNCKNKQLSDYVEPAKKVRLAYIYDNPKCYIWIDNYKCRIARFNKSIYLIYELKSEQENDISIMEEIEVFDSMSEKLVKTLHGTDKEKLKQIHDFLIYHTHYDYTLSLPNIRNAYGAIVEGRSVCSGFAYAYKHIAELAGLNVLYVVGNYYDKMTDSFSPHAWNVVCIEDGCFIVDVTFDCTPDNKYKSKFLFSPIYDGMHYADTNYFNYDF